jgi:hypothetical protein
MDFSLLTGEREEDLGMGIPMNDGLCHSFGKIIFCI